ncbi:hypothetical protein ACFL27_02710 [candidate division CSSED10-310 bacterium]|uniref:Uncharacterized protein n=1 Tax=candidate division CSSED10-310 bacterium TaxID=2855610 RepID=A0ABV6YSD0_UNCC1
MTENNEHQKKWHVGTIEGASFLMGILLLVVVFYHVLPELAQFHEYVTKDTQQLQEAIATLQTETKLLKEQVCTSDFDREMQELNAVVYVLNDLSAKGSTAVKEQSTATAKSIEDLVNLLKTEMPPKK